MELLLQHVQSKVEVVEDGVATPERDLGVLSLNVLDISLHLAEDDGSYVGLEFEHSNIRHKAISINFVRSPYVVGVLTLIFYQDLAVLIFFIFLTQRELSYNQSVSPKCTC